jgi:anti-sigma B factor antagonist
VKISLDADNPEELVLYVAGDIDASVAEELADAGRAAVRDAPQDTVFTINLSEVAFVDSTGLGALLSVLNFANERAITLTLQAVPEGVSRLLTLTALDAVFQITDE